MNQVQIFDDFLPNPESFRQKALRSAYQDLKSPDGETYRRVCPIPGRLVEGALGRVLGFPVEVSLFGESLAVLRCNFRGEAPNQSIHADSLYSSLAGVLYLNHDDQARGGTAFWKHRATGLTAWPTSDQELTDAGLDVTMPGLTLQQAQELVSADWEAPSKWIMVGMAPMKRGRLVVYPTSMFHSRWIGKLLEPDDEIDPHDFEGFGDTLETGRLIMAVFFKPKEVK